MVPSDWIIDLVHRHDKLDLLVLRDLNRRYISQRVLGLSHVTNRWPNVGNDRRLTKFVGLELQRILQHKSQLRVSVRNMVRLGRVHGLESSVTNAVFQTHQ